MYECFLGQIQAVGFGYAPKGWALCQGQLMPISQNQALFALIGTTFGGDGVTTFALPDLRARVPVGTGPMPGGPYYVQGTKAGVEQVTLNTTQIPPHIHPVQATIKASADSGEFSGVNGANLGAGTLKQFSPGPKNATMEANSVTGALSPAGGNQGHENRQPFIAMNYAIALQGIFPSQN